ncbi:MAG: hypothetical protein LBV73_01640 [Paraburkholderia sp.]|jgi:hypothetical protein|nr:hypothetical protein [Paraburkholderia sp.]
MEFFTRQGWQELLLGIMRSIKHVLRAFTGRCDPQLKRGRDASPSSSAVEEGWLNRLPYKTANQVPIRSAPHVLPSQAPRACHGLAAVTLGGAYAAVPVRRVLPACLNVYIAFDGGMWGLVRLPGTGCARRERKPAVSGIWGRIRVWAFARRFSSIGGWGVLLPATAGAIHERATKARDGSET